MSAEHAIDRPLRDFGLWLGILGPPSAWLVQFQTIYMQVYPACGVHRNLNIGFVCAGFFVVIAALGIYPARSWADHRFALDPVSRTRRFMSIVGVTSTALFLLVVIAQWIAAILVDPCTI